MGSQMADESSVMGELSASRGPVYIRQKKNTSWNMARASVASIPGRKLRRMAARMVSTWVTGSVSSGTGSLWSV